MGLKAGIRKFLRKKGYMFYKVGEGSSYTLCPPYDYATYSPWFEEPFQREYDSIRDSTKVKEDRCYILQSLCRQRAHLAGDFAECGVYMGGTAFVIADAINGRFARNRTLHLFDTFAGMPDFANEDPSAHQEGDFMDTSLERVREQLKPFPFVEFHPGVIPETFQEIEDTRFAFTHVDVDLYRTVMDCCAFFYDRMTSGGIILFDDYGFPGYELAAKRAVDEFFEVRPEDPIVLPTGQSFIIKA